MKVDHTDPFLDYDELEIGVKESVWKYDQFRYFFQNFKIDGMNYSYFETIAHYQHSIY